MTGPRPCLFGRFFLTCCLRFFRLPALSTGLLTLASAAGARLVNPCVELHELYFMTLFWETIHQPANSGCHVQVSLSLPALAQELSFVLTRLGAETTRIMVTSSCHGVTESIWQTQQETVPSTLSYSAFTCANKPGPQMESMIGFMTDSWHDCISQKFGCRYLLLGVGMDAPFQTIPRVGWWENFPWRFPVKQSMETARGHIMNTQPLEKAPHGAARHLSPTNLWPQLPETPSTCQAFRTSWHCSITNLENKYEETSKGKPEIGRTHTQTHTHTLTLSLSLSLPFFLFLSRLFLAGQLALESNQQVAKHVPETMGSWLLTLRWLIHPKDYPDLSSNSSSRRLNIKFVVKFFPVAICSTAIGRLCTCKCSRASWTNKTKKKPNVFSMVPTNTSFFNVAFENKRSLIIC